jgi:formylmethanofuran dehydrogenase subunit B
MLSSTGTVEAASEFRAATAMSLQIINNATCTFCGCVCDDIQLHHDEVRIHKANKACVLGTAWFLNHTAEKHYPDALIDGQPATLDQAITTAAQILHAADMPLVYGLSNTTCEAQRQCAALADQLGGLLDSHTSL